MEIQQRITCNKNRNDGMFHRWRYTQFNTEITDVAVKFKKSFGNFCVSTTKQQYFFIVIPVTRSTRNSF